MAPFVSGILRTHPPACLSSIRREVDICLDFVGLLWRFFYSDPTSSSRSIVCLVFCVCVCISFIYLFIFPRARNTHLSGVCSHWSQPGGGVIWWRWDPPVWPQHRAECHYARYTDQRWYVLDTVSNIMCNTFFFFVLLPQIIIWWKIIKFFY